MKLCEILGEGKTLFAFGRSPAGTVHVQGALRGRDDGIRNFLTMEKL